MPRVTLVRHGEPAGAYGVAADPGLSARGQEQAYAIARSLVAQSFHAAVTSPLQRCRETAAPYEALSGHVALVSPAVAEVLTPPDITDRRAWLAAAFPNIADPLAPTSQWDAVGLSDWRNAIGDFIRGLSVDTVVFTHFIAMNAAVSLADGSSDTIVCWPGHTGVAVFDVTSTHLRLIERPVAAHSIAT